MEPKNNLFFFGAHGKHQAWTEGNDVVHIAWHGDVSAEDVTAGAKSFELVPNGAKGFFLIMHVADQGNFPAEARRAISSDSRSGWAREVVIVGASFHVRVVLGMVSRAVTMLQTGKAKTVFLESEAELPRYIEKLRREYQASR